MNRGYETRKNADATKISECIIYLVAGTAIIATEYLIKAATFLPKKGLELFTSKITKSICKAEGIENSNLD